MQDLLKTYFIEVIDKRVKHINMYEEDEDKGTGMWEDLIKFFAMSGYREALRKGDLIEIAIQPKRGEVYWIHLYHKGDRVMIKAASINKLFGYDEIKGVDEIYFTKGGISTRKGWYFELEFEYQGRPYILRFMNRGFDLGDGETDKLMVAVKYQFGRYALMTEPLVVNHVMKRPDYDALGQ